MKAHGLNALAVAKHLESSPLVKNVIYPGLATHPRNDLAYTSLSPHARKFIDALPPSDDGSFPYGGMISFRIKGGFKEADIFLSSLKIFTLAESLGMASSSSSICSILTEPLSGGVESLAEHPARMTHGAIPEKDRELLGITDDLIRLSVGVEESDDLVRDVEHALQVSAA